MARQRAGPAGGRRVAVPHGGYGRAHAVLRAPVFDAAQYLDRPRAVEPVEDEVDKPGPPAPARSRTLVLALPQQPLDQCPGVRRDVRPAVHDLGDRRQRDTRLGGDGGQSRPVPAPRVRRVPVAARLGPRHVPSTLLPATVPAVADPESQARPITHPDRTRSTSSGSQPSKVSVTISEPELKI